MKKLIVVYLVCCCLAAFWGLSCGGGDDLHEEPDVVGTTCDPAECDDFNPCTIDSCGMDGACVNSANPNLTCDDGNACTLDDMCNAEGTCVGGQPRTCPGDDECLTEGTCVAETGCVYEPVVGNSECDENPCTMVSCDDTGDCVTSNLDGEVECDSDPCTDGDTCGNGNCTSGELVKCDDANPDDCTFPICNSESGQCDLTENRDEGQPCKDGNACTDDDTCDADGNCEPGAEHECVSLTPCKTAYCDKNKKEGTDACVEEWVPEDTYCDDGTECTENDQCALNDDGESLKCQGKPIDCDDLNSCTSDSCDEETGCVHKVKDDGTLCDLPPNYCGEKGKCLAGYCSADDVVICDDNKPCTVDTCDNGECQHTPDNSACDDANVCTDDSCDPTSGCVFTPNVGEVDGELCCEEAENCDDANVCTTNTCNDLWHCAFEPLTGTGCDDGLFCTVDDACADGVCTGGTNPCSDDIECTVDSCDDDQDTCLHETDATACDDQVDCTVNSCDAELGCQFTTDDTLCTDDIDCTTDTCDAELGCQFVTVDSECNDGLMCTADSCSAETGCVYVPLGGMVDGNDCCLEEDEECDDGNQCTKDTCNLDTHACQIANKADGDACDDGIKCTDDECQAGQCVGQAKPCDDQVECTVDSCNETDGCVNAPDDSACDDESVCTGTETCDPDDGCVAVGALDCNDNIACTTDECDAIDGCKHTTVDDLCNDNVDCTADSCDQVDGCINAPDDNACNDQVSCTNDTCDAQDGCEFVPDNDICADAFECTYDACDPKLGCLNLANDAGCDDDVTCTLDSCDELAGCKNEADDDLCDQGNPCFTYVCDEVEDCKSDYAGGTSGNIVCCEEEDAECSDGIPCTKDTCNLDTHQCEASLMANGQACTPNNLCKNQGVCDGGDCVATDKVCDDNLPCTDNECNPDSGCFYTPDDAFCSDDNDCTAETCDINNGCDYPDLDGQDCDDDDSLTVDDKCDEDLCKGLPDPDADGIANEGYDEVCMNLQTDACNDNCPSVSNPDQADEDGNGDGDACSNLVLKDSGQAIDWAYYGDSADVDDDGDIDVIGHRTNLRLYINDGSGVFTTHDISSPVTPHWPTLADIDGDNVVDLIVGKNNDGSGRVVLNDGAGEFNGTVTSFGGSSRCEFEFYNTYAADMDGDNDLDIVTRAPDCGAHIYRNDTAEPGTTSLVQITGGVLSAPGHAGVSVFDVDGDTDPDILLAHDSGNLRLMVNDGQGGMSESQKFNISGLTEHRGMAPADYDGDGDIDAMYAADTSWPAGHMRYLENNAGKLSPKSTIAEPANLGRSFTAVDMDLDGDFDIVVAGSGSSAIYYNDGNAAFEIGDSLPAANHIEVEDFNGDGLPDLFIFNQGGCKLLVSEWEAP